jgi:predicted DNA-binding protein
MKEKVPMSLRFPEGLERRLEECAARLQVRKHTLAQQAIEAAVQAIEQNDFRLVVPVAYRFEVTHVPTARSYPMPGAHALELNEKPAPPPQTGPPDRKPTKGPPGPKN